MPTIIHSCCDDGDSNRITTIRFDLTKTTFVEYNNNRDGIHNDDEPVLLTDIYYVQADYDRILTENQATFDMIARGGINDEESFCRRGLEKKRRDIRRRAQEAVLEEQWRQRNEGVEDHHNILAEIYRGYTLVCEVTARRRGTMDAMAAKQIYSNVNVPTKLVSRYSFSDDSTEVTEDLSEPLSRLSDDDDDDDDVDDVVDDDATNDSSSNEISNDDKLTKVKIRPTFFGRMFRQSNRQRCLR